MTRRVRFYDDDPELVKAFNEKVHRGDYEVLRELDPDEIEEYESLHQIATSNKRALDRAYRSFINHEASNEEDLVRWYERTSQRKRYDKNYSGLVVTRHKGRVVLAQVKEDKDEV